MKTFLPIQLSNGFTLALDSATVLAFNGEDPLEWSGGTGYGMVVGGTAKLTCALGELVLRPGMFFVATGDAMISGGTGMVIHNRGYLGLGQIGGPVESQGRLRYIDGCTDTLLVCPPRLGDPSLNHLHVPRRTLQTDHFHDSDRIGVVLTGRGICRTEAGDEHLTPGMGWYIPAGVRHCFVTEAHALDVIAWHPDSVFGPTDEAHPMLLGTIR
jgi:quercetin dioxygenase-like cupin family protein